MEALEYLVDLISHLCRAQGGPPPGVPVHAPDTFENELVETSVRTGTAPLVQACLGGPREEVGISELGRERLGDAARAVVREGEKTRAWLEKLIPSLEKAGIEHLVVGPSAARLFYKDPSWRGGGEIDLLVREEDWQGLAECMRAVGLFPPCSLPCLAGTAQVLSFFQFFAPCLFGRGDEVVVRVRFRLIPFGVAPVREVAWNGAERVSSSWGEAPVPPGSDLLVDALLRWLLWGGLLPLADAGFIAAAGKVDGNRLMSRFHETGLGRLLERTLGATLALLQLPSHRGVSVDQNLRVDPGEMIAHRSWPSPLVFYLRQCSRRTDKLRAFLALASPPREWVSSYYGCPYRPALALRFVVSTLAGATYAGWGRAGFPEGSAVRKKGF